MFSNKESKSVSDGFNSDGSDILFRNGIPEDNEIERQIELVRNMLNLKQKNETLETLLETVMDKNGGIKEKVNVERYRQNIRANNTEIKRDEKSLRTFFKKYGLRYSGEASGDNLKTNILSDIELYLYELKSKVKESEGYKG